MDEHQTSAVKQAITDHDGQALAKLLEESGSVAGARDDSGVTLIMLALYHRHQDLVEQLVAACDRPLDVFELAALGQVEELEAALQTDPAKARAISPDGFSVLGLAAFFGRTEIVEVLVEGGAEVDRPSQNPMKVCPLHSAAATVDPQVGTRIGRLLLAAGADPDVQQQGGYTPLQQAAAHGNMRLLRLLLEHDASPAIANDEGQLAVDLARQGGHSEAVKLLESHD